jgi:hypothetical protein
VSVRGFTVTNALGGGILAAGVQGTISGISIEHNKVVHNDLGGGVPPVSSYFECQPAGPVPGDCGEGVHFIAVAYSQVQGELRRAQLGRVAAHRRDRADAQQPDREQTS